MSSKELLVPAIKTLAKKVNSFSSASKKSRSHTHKSNDGDNPPSVHAQTSDDLSATRVSSAAAVASENGDTTSLPRKPTFADWGDVVEVPPATVVTSPDPGEPRIQITDTQILDAATACFSPVTENADLPLLPKPVVMPRLDQGSSVPFARAWPPELADHAITQEDFVAFIDNLNIAISPNVAILVPYDVAEGVGGALEAIATLGAIAVNYKRTKDYLALTNEKYFHPRKLHVKIVNTKRLKTLLKLDKKDALLAPLTEDTLELSSQQRCLRYLSKYSCELSFDAPAPSPATTTLAKITAWQIKQKIRKADEAAKSARKRTWKRHQKGKKLQGRWESMGEKSRVRSLDWILVQNLQDWEARKAEKEVKKNEKKKKNQGGEGQTPAPA